MQTMRVLNRTRAVRTPLARATAVLLLLAVCLTAAACRSGASSVMPVTFDAAQYSLWCNVGADTAGTYNGLAVNVTGTFAVLHDPRVEGGLRYYVWGYADQTLCCDWEWEFQATPGMTLPPAGSRVRLTGRLTVDNSGSRASLDAFWVTDAALETVQPFERPDAAPDFDLTLLNPTLTRVQLALMRMLPDTFRDKSVRVYARVAGPGSLQHPYYDNNWVLSVEGASLPAIGTYVTVEGTFRWESDLDYGLKGITVSASK